MKNKHYIVYRTENLITGEYYIGVHGQLQDDNYLGSGVHLKRQIQKYGRENFSRVTLATFASESEAFSHEILLLETHLLDSLCLNISKGGDGGANFLGKLHSEATREKLKVSSTGRKVSEETRARLSEANKKRSPESRAKAAETLKARWASGEVFPHLHSEETKQILREKHKPHKQTEETRRKLSEAAIKRFSNPDERRKVARVWTIEERQEWGKIQKDKWSPELRKKISESNRGKTPWNKRLSCGHIHRDKCECKK